MIHATIIGRVGRDAEVKEAAGSKVCSFSVACDQGYGDRKSTNWIRVSIWGSRGDKLAPMISKGQRVAVRGSLETREKDGKVYLEVRADELELLGGGETRGNDKPASPAADPFDAGPF